LVVPTWTATDPRQFAAAQRVRDWLPSPAGRAALATAALSSPVDCVSTGFALDGGFTPNRCLPVDPESAQELFDSAKTPGRVLMVMDTSGSMGQAAPGGHDTRLQLATAAFGQAIGQIGGQDELGLWMFPARSDPPHRTLLQIGAGTVQRRTTAVTALRNLKPQGNTPLYRTLLDGLTAVTSGAAAGHTTALVVLTDGQDTDHMDAGTVRDAIAAKSAATGVRVYVVAIGDAACAGSQALSSLIDGHGSCIDADFDHISDTMARLFERLWKGQ
jgi:Mg-chelatase subunit ChlD